MCHTSGNAMKSLSRFHVFCGALLLLLGAPKLVAQWLPPNPVKIAETQPDGVLLTLEHGYLQFRVCSDSIVHIIYSLERHVPERPDSLVIKENWPHADFSLQADDPKTVILATSRLKIAISKADSSIVSTIPKVTNSLKKIRALSLPRK